MTGVEILCIILTAIMGVYGAYYVVFGIIGLLHRYHNFAHCEKNHHFTVLVPARNEEAVIGECVDSLKKQHYPKNCYTINVICDHCTDRTAEIARKHGAQIIINEADTHSKGEVLRRVFHLTKKRIRTDAYIIFDADNLVDPDYLSRMNDAYGEGYRVAQGRRVGKNIGDSWVSTCYELFFIIQNNFLNHARFCVGKSSYLNGTGVMISKDIVDRDLFLGRSVTEDMELEANLALSGVNIAYVHEAVTYDEYPLTAGTALKQLLRWYTGQMECLRRFGGTLLKNAFQKKSFACLDKFLFFIMQIVSMVSLGVQILCAVTGAPGINVILAAIPAAVLALAAAVIYLAVTLALGFVLRHFRGQTAAQSLPGALMFPVFMNVWIPVSLMWMFGGAKKYRWEPIRHVRSLNIEDMQHAGREESA